MQDGTDAPPEDDDTSAAAGAAAAGEGNGATPDGEKPERELTSYTVYLDPAQFDTDEINEYEIQLPDGPCLLELGDHQAWDRARAVALCVEELERQAKDNDGDLLGLRGLVWSRIKDGQRVDFHAPHARALTAVAVQDKIERKRTVG